VERQVVQLFRPYRYDEGKIVFAKGDMAVYPAHGVGVIKSIETHTVAGVDQTFYVLQILDNRMKIMIPTQSSEHLGLRSIVSKQEVDEVISILKERDTEIGSQTWNRRYRDYMDKIKTGSIHDLAEVLRDLFLLSVDKDLSYGERKMLDTARGLLVKELSLAQQVDEEKISQRIDTIFS